MPDRDIDSEARDVAGDRERVLEALRLISRRLENFRLWGRGPWSALAIQASARAFDTLSDAVALLRGLAPDADDEAAVKAHLAQLATVASSPERAPIARNAALVGWGAMLLELGRESNPELWALLAAVVADPCACELPAGDVLKEIIRGVASPEWDQSRIRDQLMGALAALDEPVFSPEAGSVPTTESPALEDRILTRAVSRRGDEPWAWSDRRLAETLGVSPTRLRDALARDLGLPPGSTTETLRDRVRSIEAGDLSTLGRFAREWLFAKDGRRRPVSPVGRRRQAQQARQEDDATRADVGSWGRRIDG